MRHGVTRHAVDARKSGVLAAADRHAPAGAEADRQEARHRLDVHRDRNALRSTESHRMSSLEVPKACNPLTAFPIPGLQRVSGHCRESKGMPGGLSVMRGGHKIHHRPVGNTSWDLGAASSGTSEVKRCARAAASDLEMSGSVPLAGPSKTLH